MELFNTQTREREDVQDEESLHKALVSGTHSYKAGAQVPGVDPDGQPVNIPAESVADAIRSGYRINTANRNAVESYVDENKGIKGAAKVFFSQAADELAIGLPEMVFEATGDPLEVAKREALKKEHAAANIAGGTLGFGGSLLVGGPLWKGAAKAGQATTKATANLLAEKIVAKSAGEVSKSKARQIARDFIAKTGSKAAGGAVEGAIVSSPIAITEAMLGDPEAAAESLLAGIGIGGIFGGVAGAGGVLGGKFKEVVKDTKAVRKLREYTDDVLRTGKAGDNKFLDMADEKAFEALDPKKHHLKRVSANEEILDEFGNAISLTRSRDTKKIGRTLREEGILQGLPDIGEIAQRIQRRTGELSDEVAEAFKRLDDTYAEAAVVDMGEAVASIRKNVLPKLEKNKAIHAEVARFKRELDVLEGAAPPFTPDELAGIDFGDLNVDGLPIPNNNLLSLAEANTLKGDYQRKIGDTAITESKTFKDLLNEIPKEINRQVRQKIGSLDKTELDLLIRNQRKLGNLKAAEKIAVDRAEAAVSNNDFGLTSFITGIGGASLFDGGLSSIIGGGLIGGGREFTRRHGDLMLSKAYDRVGGLLFAEQAMKRTALEVDRIPKILDRMAKGAKEVTDRSRAASIPAIIRLFKEDAPKRPAAAAAIQAPLPRSPKTKKLKQLQDAMGPLVGNPEALLDRIAELTEPLTGSGAPESGAVLSERISRVMNYISAVMPKAPRANSPFAPRVEWEPSDYEMAAFDQKLSVVMDPFSVLDELEAGTLTRNHMEALKTIYPVIFSAMQTRVQNAVISGVEPIPYSDRVKLSLLMDAPMDPSLEKKAIAFYQRAFNVMQDQEQGDEPMPQGIKVNIAEGVATQSQRILGG